MEFIISEYIKVHPLALLHTKKVDDPGPRRTIDRLTQGYADGYVREGILKLSNQTRI